MPVSLSAERRFAPQAASVPEVRRFVADQLAQWGRDASVWTAQLAVSELATNAVLHAGTGDVTVTVELLAGGDLLLRVGDASRRPPRVRQYGPAATTGRGIALVAELAQDWGVEADGDGKVVWCRLAPAGGGRPGLTAVDDPAPDAVPDLDAFLGVEDRDDPHADEAAQPRSGATAG